MNTELARLLVIDDDKFLSKHLSKTLASEYTIQLAHTGEDGLEMAKFFLPNLILLDVEMPGLDGYAVCERLRAMPELSHTIVIFASSHHSLQDRVRSYEAGGDDYLVKPFEVDELKAKLQAANRREQQVLKLEEQWKVAQDTALTAMMGSSEMGQALAFSRACYSIRTYKELARSLIGTCGGFGLNAMVMFVTREGNFSFSHNGDVTKLEEELVFTIKKQNKRIFDFGARTQISYPRVALLIKNMPLADADRYGRMKDLLPFMLESAEAKVMHMAAEQAMLQQTKQLLDAFMRVESALQTVAHRYESHHAAAKTIFTELLVKLETDLPRLGLEEDQEDYLRDMIFNAVDRSMDQTEVASESRLIFDSIVAVMRKLVEKQQLVVDEILLQKFDVEEMPDEQRSDSGGDAVELF